MVQVLPYVPSFGERLAPVLGEAIGKTAEGFSQKRASDNLNNYLAKFRQPVQGQEPGALGQMSQIGDQSAQVPFNSQEVKFDDMLNIYELAKKAKDEKYADNVLKAINEDKKMAFKERQLESKENIEAYKATSEYRENLLNKYEAAKRTTTQLDRLDELNKSGKLTTPTMAKFAESFGIPLAVLSNPESEEFQKVSQDLLSNIKDTFGNKILLAEVENFLKTIPTLMNSEEGRTRIIRDLKLLYKGAEVKYNAYRKLTKKGGKIPLDIHEQVLDASEDELNKIADDFKKGIGVMTERPEASKHIGSRLEDQKTGQIFISNGKEWVPE